jgi:hypothetical protein
MPMDFTAVGAPGAPNYASPLVNFGIPGLTSNVSPPPQQKPAPPAGQPGDPTNILPQQSWIDKLKQFLNPTPMANTVPPGMPSGGTAPVAGDLMRPPVSPDAGPPTGFAPSTPVFSPGERIMGPAPDPSVSPQPPNPNNLSPPYIPSGMTGYFGSFYDNVPGPWSR